MEKKEEEKKTLNETPEIEDEALDEVAGGARGPKAPRIIVSGSYQQEVFM